jgi:hypothetical protein
MRWEFLAGFALATLLFSNQANSTPLFSDDFDRADSTVVGNGWTEVDGTNLHSYIESNALVMSQTGGLPADPNDGQDTRIFRLGSDHSNIVLSGTLSIEMFGPGGAQQSARVVVRSTGTEGTGPRDGFPCGVFGSTPPDCWRGDGFGFALWADAIDQEAGGRLQITDDGLELAGIAFPIVNGSIYNWEMEINASNHVALFFWDGARPSLPTLEFDNGGYFYTPLAPGDLWQLEVKNTNDDIGLSHQFRTTWDDFQIAAIPEPSTALLLASGLAALAARRGRRSFH